MAEDKTENKAAGKEPASMSFEEALAELEEIVVQLERGSESLAAGVALYERGVALKMRCEALLRDAQMKVEQIELRAGKAAGVSAMTQDGGSDQGDG